MIFYLPLSTLFVIVKNQKKALLSIKLRRTKGGKE